MKNKKFKQARALAVVKTLQRQSVQVGTDKFSSRDIVSEIKIVRKALHQ